MHQRSQDLQEHDTDLIYDAASSNTRKDHRRFSLVIPQGVDSSSNSTVGLHQENNLQASPGGFEVLSIASSDTA